MNASLTEPHLAPTALDVPALLLNDIENRNTRAMYAKALTDFLNWCQAEGGIQLTGLVVEDHKKFLLSRGYSAGTINQRLTAIRKFARRAAQEGLLPSHNAAEILGVRGEKKDLPLADGPSLSIAEAESLLSSPNVKTNKGKRDRALLALLLGCGLRRNEIVQLKVEDILRWQGRWVLAHVGSHKKERIVPLPGWVKQALDGWLGPSRIHGGAIFRALDRDGTVLSRVLSAQMILTTVASYGKSIGIQIAPRDLRRTCAKLCRKSGAELEDIQLLLGHASIQETGKCVGGCLGLARAPNDRLRLKWTNLRRRGR